jgi:hypothetical protein
LSRQSKAKRRSTAVANFTPKELGEPSANHSEFSKMLMQSVFLAVGGWLPQLSEWRRLLIGLRVTGLNLRDSEKEYFGIHSANKMMQEVEAWGFAVIF